MRAVQGIRAVTEVQFCDFHHSGLD